MGYVTDNQIQPKELSKARYYNLLFDYLGTTLRKNGAFAFLFGHLIFRYHNSSEEIDNFFALSHNFEKSISALEASTLLRLSAF